MTVVVNGRADVASGFLSTGNYYRALGATARLGRTIDPTTIGRTRRRLR